MAKKILVFIAIALVLIQFIHPKKNNSEGIQAHYIGSSFQVPEKVKEILDKACNDCHSNNTNYPWYTRIQPIHWWLNHHIQEGKSHLNFDEYTNRNLRFQYHKMEELDEQVSEGEMPLTSYTWAHKEAILTEAEKKELLNWAAAIRKTMEEKYPRDSLIRKK